MMNKSKKTIIVTCLLTCIMMICSSALAFAGTSDTVITADEYYATIKSEYSKYGIGFKVNNYNPDFIYTRELLETQLDDIRTEMSSVKNYDAKKRVYIEKIEDCVISEVSPTNGSPRIMPVTKYFTYTARVDSPKTIGGVRMGWANIEQKVTTTVDAQSNYIMSINNVTTRQYGAALNFQSWTQNSYTKSIGNGGKSMLCLSYGTLSIAYSDPFTGGSYTYTSDHQFGATYAV